MSAAAVTARARAMGSAWMRRARRARGALRWVRRPAEWLSFRFQLLAWWVEAQQAHVSFRCLDCDTDTLGEYYSVWDDVWEAAGAGADDGMLCIGCLEHRLGRRLMFHDFTAAPINFNGAGPRVRERICG